MNESQVRVFSTPDQVVRAWNDGQGYRPALADALAGAESIAFDDESRSGFLLDLLDAAPRVRAVGAARVMRALRIRKDADELASLRRAAATVDDSIVRAIARCQSGRTEAEVDADLRRLLLERSPESTIAFTIVCGGPNAAFPHHETGTRPMQHGQVALLDFGTREPDGYVSDITVTCCIGEPADAEVRTVYAVVHAAQQAAFAAVRPGATCGQVDAAARGVIERAGYGANFLHRTGHGLGLQVHEHPYLAPGSTDVLEEGMVFSIEPGIYLAGRFGVRLEVIATVTADGAALINKPSAPELPIVFN